MSERRVMFEHAAVVFERDLLLDTLDERTAALRAAVQAQPPGDVAGALVGHAEAMGAWCRFVAAHPGVVVGRG
ncbi:hypothetical protein ACO0LV_01860 [Pseudactinotalea sp. Z1739]|uniref:hypothetical protein n=1 Tax=Pseudactinotalea sp. Z1739 TaxID=3413028 RepID=UPI003C7B1753